jgi:hypothetical protein
MVEKKYEILKDDAHTIGRGFGDAARKFHQIKALRDITHSATGDVTVRAGELGGYVENADNLSHNGNAWIYNDGSKAIGDSRITDNAQIRGASTIEDRVKVSGNADVNNSTLTEDVQVSDKARVDNTQLSGEKHVKGEKLVRGGTGADNYGNLNSNGRYPS